MKVPFITKTSNAKHFIQAKSAQSISSCNTAIPQKHQAVKSNIYRKLINYIDNFRGNSLPEDTKNIDSMF